LAAPSTTARKPMTQMKGPLWPEASTIIAPATTMP
jgi:hypothetical protein